MLGDEENSVNVFVEGHSTFFHFHTPLKLEVNSCSSYKNSHFLAPYFLPNSLSLSYRYHCVKIVVQ